VVRTNGAFLIVVGVLAAVACHDIERYPEPPIAPHRVKLSVANVAGCYEVTAFQWAPGTPTNVRASVWPRFFILQSFALTNPWFEHPIVQRDAARDAGGSWRLTGDTEVTMEWYRRASTALSVRAHSPSWENSLLGLVAVRAFDPLRQAVVDTPRGARVVMERIPCWPGADLIGTPDRVYTNRPLS